MTSDIVLDERVDVRGVWRETRRWVYAGRGRGCWSAVDEEREGEGERESEEEEEEKSSAGLGATPQWQTSFAARGQSCPFQATLQEHSRATY